MVGLRSIRPDHTGQLPAQRDVDATPVTPERDTPLADEGMPDSRQRAVASPLDAAFKRPLVTSRVTELFEHRVLHDQGPSLVAYGRFDPQARPVVLVHGMRGSGEELTALADRLTAAGRQVYFFQYNDTGELTSVNGEHLANALRGLATQSQHRDQPLDIVAHSMGGIVTRVAMNTLAQAGVPGAGFPSVRVQTLDTPLDGYIHESRFWAWTNPIALFVMRLIGMAGYYDMRGSSAMFEGLYATGLSNVTFSNTAAYRTDRMSTVTRRAHDFDAHDQSAIASYLAGGPLPERPRARNYARALEHDVHGPALRARLREELRSQNPAEALLRAYDAVMPQVAGTHTSFLDEREPIERVVRALTEPVPRVANAAPR